MNLSQEIIGPNILDKKILSTLKKLDQYIMKSAPYEKYERLTHKVEDGLVERFSIWLESKEVQVNHQSFVFIIQVYLNFFYGYEHPYPLTLQEGPDKYLVEFVADFLLRKTFMEPWEYPLAPAALRLFYTFLFEKEYLPEPPYMMTEFLKILEPHYLALLKERFS
jgi:hypothetical protein